MGFMKKIFIVLTLLLLLIPCLGASHNIPSNKYAVVFGFGGGQGRVPKAYDCGGDWDAKVMNSILKDAGFTTKNIYFKTNNKVTMAEWFNAFDWLLSVEDENSTVVIFYSGHGGPNVLGSTDFGMPEDTLASVLSGLDSKKQAVLIRQCGADSLIDALEAPDRIIITTEGTGYRRGSIWGHYFLKEALKEGKGDINGDGKISLEEAYWHFRWECTMSDNYEGEFLL